MTDPSETQEHRIAMAMHTFVGALGDLHTLASDDATRDLMRNEFEGLTTSFEALGSLLIKINRQHLVAAE